MSKSVEFQKVRAEPDRAARWRAAFEAWKAQNPNGRVADFQRQALDDLTERVLGSIGRGRTGTRAK